MHLYPKNSTQNALLDRQGCVQTIVYSAQMVIFSLFLIGVNKIHSVLYNQFHLDQAYQLLASDESFTKLLTLDLLPSDQGQEPAVAAPDIDPVITEVIEVVPLVEGNIPPEYPEQREYSTTASLALCLDNQEEYTRLGRYLHERGQLDVVPGSMDGTCMFENFRKAVDAPLEYTSAHLRHQLIITIHNHKEFFYPLLMESIKDTYGFPRMDLDEYQWLYDEGLLTDVQVDDHNTPGPYSFLGYLRALQKPDF